jgi:hypothetical protein
MNSRDRYKDASTHALAGFQLVEEGLKNYIGHYYDAVRKTLDGRLHFQHCRSDVEKAALDKLLNIFIQVNANDDLVKALKQMLKYRNDLAHKALTHLYGEPKSDEEFDAMTDSAIEAAKKLGELMSAIHEETLRVLVIASDVQPSAPADALQRALPASARR